jgi:hypothetical protein
MPGRNLDFETAFAIFDGMNFKFGGLLPPPMACEVLGKEGHPGC